MKITQEELTRRLENKDNLVNILVDKNKKGNLNLRIVNETLRVNCGRKAYEYYKLFIPEKYQIEVADLLVSGQAYNVRLIKQDKTHYEVIIDYEVEDPQRTINLNNGAIGVDVNVDRVAYSNLTKDGNLIESNTIINNRLQFGSTNKRLYDMAVICKQIINYSIENNKGIVFEDLNFKKESLYWRSKLHITYTPRNESTSHCFLR